MVVLELAQVIDLGGAARRLWHGPPTPEDAAFAARRIDSRSGTCSLAQTMKLSSYDVAVCASPPGNRPAWMVIGDSVAASTYMILKRAYPDVYFGQMTLPGCPGALPDAVRQASTEWCRKRLALGFELARTKGFDGIVASVNWGLWQKRDMDALVAWAAQNRRRLVVVTGGPRFTREVPLILAEAGSPQAGRDAANGLIDTNRMARNLQAVQGLTDPVRVVNLFPLACPDGCDVTTPAGAPIFLDTHHVSVVGAELLAARLKAAMPDLFASP
jgi:hypothetical protein